MNKIWDKIKKGWKWIVGLFVGTAIAVTVANYSPPLGDGVQQPTYFAEVDKNGIVLRVIVITQEELNKGNWGDPKDWIETKIDGSLRTNYAGIGYIYDGIKDKFVAPQLEGYILNETTGKWGQIPISPTASI